MAVVSRHVQVSGIRCERCVDRLAVALQDHEGLESANANLMGVVTLAWDDEKTDRERLLEAMSRAGFREIARRLSRRGIRARAGLVAGLRHDNRLR